MSLLLKEMTTIKLVKILAIGLKTVVKCPNYAIGINILYIYNKRRTFNYLKQSCGRPYSVLCHHNTQACPLVLMAELWLSGRATSEGSPFQAVVPCTRNLLYPHTKFPFLHCALVLVQTQQYNMGGPILLSKSSAAYFMGSGRHIGKICPLGLAYWSKTPPFFEGLWKRCRPSLQNCPRARGPRTASFPESRGKRWSLNIIYWFCRFPHYIIEI